MKCTFEIMKFALLVILFTFMNHLKCFVLMFPELCEPVQPGALSQRWRLFSNSRDLLDLPLSQRMDWTLL